jgi:hypothetical protein
MKQEGDIIKDAIAGNKSVVSSRDAIFKEILKEAQDAEVVESEKKD